MMIGDSATETHVSAHDRVQRVCVRHGKTLQDRTMWLFESTINVMLPDGFLGNT